MDTPKMTEVPEASEVDAEYAHRSWLFIFADQEVDENVRSFLAEDIKARRGWLKMVRKALFISTSGAAKRLGITRQNYIKLEKNEFSGSIQVATLEKAA